MTNDLLHFEVESASCRAVCDCNKIPSCGQGPVGLQISKHIGLQVHLQMHHSAQQFEADPGLQGRQSPGGGVYLQVFVALGEHHVEVDDKGMDVVVAQGFYSEWHLHKADMSH